MPRLSTNGRDWGAQFLQRHLLMVEPNHHPWAPRRRVLSPVDAAQCMYGHYMAPTRPKKIERTETYACRCHPEGEYAAPSCSASAHAVPHKSQPCCTLVTTSFAHTARRDCNIWSHPYDRWRRHCEMRCNCSCGLDSTGAHAPLRRSASSILREVY